MISGEISQHIIRKSVNNTVLTKQINRVSTDRVKLHKCRKSASSPTLKSYLAEEMTVFEQSSSPVILTASPLSEIAGTMTFHPSQPC